MCIVKWFWQVVGQYSDERRAQLLQFVTGSSRVPIEGFKALQGEDHVIKVPSLPTNYPCYSDSDCYRPGRGTRLSLAHFLIAIMINSACEFAVFLSICIISFKLSL